MSAEGGEGGVPVDQALMEYWRDTEHNPQKMWDSYLAEHRLNAIHTVARLDVNSVYEIGCGAGPNLRLLRERFPKMLLAGGELHKGHREFANQHFPVEHLELPTLPDLHQYDCVLSKYTLAYVRGVSSVLKGLYEQGVKYLVLIEPSAHSHPFWSPGFYEGHAMGSYVHDYRTLGHEAGWKTLWRWPITPHVQGLNVVLVMER
jgi:SAM-dependent methyltransferase